MGRRAWPRTAAGAGAGVMGGIVYALALSRMGMFSSIAEIFHLRGDVAGWVLHLCVSAVLGGLYGFVHVPATGPSRLGDGLANGTVYGLVWWCLGSLTLSPLLRSGQVGWSMAQAGAEFPNLLGHLAYGAVTGLVFQVVALTLAEREPLPRDGVATRHRVVILGGGFGGMAAAMRWEKLLRRRPDIDVTLVSDSNYSLFTPMLAEVAGGGLEPAHISSSVRSFLGRVQFRRALVNEIDLVTRTVSVQSSETSPPSDIAFDQVLVSLGSTSHDFGLPGIAEHAYTLKTLEDAILLREHVITTLELADATEGPPSPGLLTFVVAGGGFSGMEIVAELYDLVHHALPYYPRLAPQDTRFVLVHGGAHVLPELSERLGDYALRKLRERGIEFLLEVRVTGCTADQVMIKDSHPVVARTLIWTTGNRAHPVVESLIARDARRITTDPALRSVSDESVWAVGDCAANPMPDGSHYAPTAQNASRSGKLAADNMLAVIDGRPVRPFVFAPLGLLVVLGRRTAAAEIGRFEFSGLLAWLLWRGIYLSKLPGLEKKVRVFLDWTVEFFFPRDLVLAQRVTAPARPERPSRTHSSTQRVAP